MPTTSHTTDPLSAHQDFSVLSLSDLLLARDKNHVDLMRRQNVVGTAVGYYLIRHNDPWPKTSHEQKSAGHRTPRTLGNSGIRPYSWPCILVFVNEWMAEKDLPWTDRVPPALYLEDNRKVPVCVVEAPLQERIETIVESPLFPTSRIGGGFPVAAEVQGFEHIASIGCIVSDGHTAYALTNRHVTGEPGEPIYTKVGGTMIRIGESARERLQLRRLPFQKLYPNWAGKDVYVNLDIGLIRIDDLTQWTAQVYGVGTVGAIADLGPDNISLRLIDAHVSAYGCASRHLRGAVKALFYRYKSIGGFDYVADFLIGPRNNTSHFSTRPGDSGTLWLLEEKDGAPRPLALQWGGQQFLNPDGQSTGYALATCLSTVCNLLQVDVIRDWNLGVTDYWGEVGHYTIGGLACTVGFSNQPGLQKFMEKNLDRVGFEADDLKDTDKVLRSKAHFDFVPLADVADEIWRITRPSDANNHFADMDQKATKGKYAGKTLLKLCAASMDNVDPQVWSDFYAGTPGTNPGALPFRVWQSYVEGVKRLADGDLAGFLAAVGTMGHYVGDACQPLHISRLHHGVPPVKKGSVAYNVHSAYETQMLNAHAEEIVDGVVKYLKGKKVKPSFKGGKAAAQRVVQLMQETFDALPPQEIVDTYNEGTSPADRVQKLWDAFSEKTIERIGEGCICLAEIWASAWKEGGGESISGSKLAAIDEDDLKALYNDKTFLPSVGLKSMIDLLTPSAEGDETAHEDAGATEEELERPAPRKRPRKRAA
jgi:hypothetical protein